ncbi:MAG TPA: hypothetical protein VH969_11585 [Actinophytocola sp.]|uniref:ribosomal protein L7/L12 n=1 Tax=Actinophytocola sp. TaxID=1872138 RepID=UPI002F9572B7
MPVALQIALYAVLAVAVVADLIRRGRTARSRPPATQPAPEVVERLRGLLAAGRRIQAIKELRAATGMGLAAAKDYVDRLHAGEPR